MGKGKQPYDALAADSSRRDRRSHEKQAVTRSDLSKPLPKRDPHSSLREAALIGEVVLASLPQVWARGEWRELRGFNCFALSPSQRGRDATLALVPS